MPSSALAIAISRALTRPSRSRRARRRSSSEPMSSQIANADIVGYPSPDHNIRYSQAAFDATLLASHYKRFVAGFRRPEVPARTQWQSICTTFVAGLRHLTSEPDGIARTELCARVRDESNFPAPRPGREGLESVNFAVIPDLPGRCCRRFERCSPARCLDGSSSVASGKISPYPQV